MTNKDPIDGEELLRRFHAMPTTNANKELLIEFTNEGRFTRADEAACFALKLPVGESISQSGTEVEPGGLHFDIYAQTVLAEKILGIPKGIIMNAKVKTVSAIGTEVCGLVERNCMFLGLLILELL